MDDLTTRSSNTELSVGVVILNFNTAQAVIDLYDHITSLRRGRRSPTYLVVDNASQPKDAELLELAFSKKKDVHVSLNPRNVGYAAGNNVGLKKARDLGLDYCLIANSDIAFETADFLEQFIEAASTLEQCGLIGPQVVLPNGRPQGPLPETGVINGIVPQRVAKYATTTVVYATVGCCIFGPTKTFVCTDFLDENTFLYREEIILAERLRAAGLHWYYLPNVIVRHNHVRKIQSSDSIRLHKRFEAESTVYYFRRYKHRSVATVLFYRALLSAKVVGMIALASLHRRRRAGVNSPSA